MAGTVVTSRITDVPFYFTRRCASTGGLLKGDIFDVSKSYSSGWLPAVQLTTSYRSGKTFLKALNDPRNQVIRDEDSRDLPIPDDSRLLLKFETNDLKKATSYDRGHEFSSTKVERSMTPVTLSNPSGSVSYYGPVTVFSGVGGLNSAFDGGVFTDSGAPHIIQSTEWPSIDLSYGTKAISKTIPTLPVAGVAAFVGELHEGLPRLIGHSALFKERAHAFHAAGDEYLNYQFGWKPFESDVKKFAKAFLNAGKILDTYRKNSGKVQRRHYTFREVRTNKVYPEGRISVSSGNPFSSALRFPADNTVYGAFSSPEIDSFFPSGASAAVHSHYICSQKYWFTGAYSYLLQEDDSFFGRMERYSQLANKLIGIRLTPDVLWELTPWSWLADWEGNIGVNITNMTALGQDNLALRWGYLMRTTSFKHYSSTSTLTSYGGWSGPLHTTYRITRKERVKSTPFGFGLNTGSFTDHQWSILGALGITRAPKKLF